MGRGIPRAGALLALYAFVRPQAHLLLVFGEARVCPSQRRQL